MPVINHQGSSEYTEFKERIFYDLIKQNIVTFNAICKKKKWKDCKYLFIDATSGSGWNDGHKGSPLQTWDAINSIKAPLNFEIKAYFIERVEDNLNLLKDNIPPRCQRNSRFVHGEYCDCIPSILKQEGSNLGSLYIDPNGVIEFEVLKNIINNTEYMKMMDVILYLGATSIKRTRTKNYNINELATDIRNTKKDRWFVSDYWGRNQWAFFVGTNSKSFVPRSNGVKFYDISSSIGERFLHKLTFTHKEYPFHLPGQRSLDEISKDEKEGY